FHVTGVQTCALPILKAAQHRGVRLGEPCPFGKLAGALCWVRGSTSSPRTEEATTNGDRLTTSAEGSGWTWDIATTPFALSLSKGGLRAGAALASWFDRLTTNGGVERAEETGAGGPGTLGPTPFALSLSKGGLRAGAALASWFDRL